MSLHTVLARRTPEVPVRFSRWLLQERGHWGGEDKAGQHGAQASSVRPRTLGVCGEMGCLWTVRPDSGRPVRRARGAKVAPASGEA